MSEEEHTCCLCNETYDEYHNLFDANDESNSVYDIVEAYFPEEMLITKNPLGNSVLCSECWNIIADFHEFRRAIYDVHDSLKSKYNNEIFKITEHTNEDDTVSEGQFEEDLNEVKTITIIDSDCESISKNYIIQSENEYENESEMEESSIQIENHKKSNLSKIDEMENIIAECMPEIECHKCYQSFNKFSLLRTHFKERHPKLQFYVTCCEKKFSIRSLLVHHLRLHMNPELYKCKICGECKTTKRYLSNHMQLKHKNSEHSDDIDSESISPKKTNIQEDKCKESRLKKIEDLENFISEYMPEINCHECHKSFTRFALLRKHFKQRHPTLMFYVTCCDKKMCQRATLAYHLRLHGNPDLYKCDICGERKTSKRSLLHHRRQLHNNNEPLGDSPKSHLNKHFTPKSILFSCPHCPRQYALKKKLESHIKTSHNLPEQPICEHCGETMLNQYYVRKHAVMHGLMKGTPRKTYKCDICDRVLQGLDSLKRHNAAMHHDGTTEFICGECGKASYSKAALMAHKRNVHTMPLKKFKCDECGKAFRKSRDVALHMVTHTKEKLYKCPDCDKKFTRPSNMLHHRKYSHPEEYEKHRKSTPRIKVDPKNISNKVVI
ncbi:zinc finger protein 816-like [Calliphora vicina]|uniref:zinc finger protein 816-like n=1 Tax=Calliphora vicina TaxID=7373 RepID=UPI00325B262E